MAFGNGRGSGASDVAHKWAHQTGRGNAAREGNVFYEGDTIYSYGYHFPMGRLMDGVAIVNANTYSNSTSTHQSRMRQAVSHLETISCYHMPRNRKDVSTHQTNVDTWISQLDEPMQKLLNARKPEKYMQKIASIRQQADRYISHFNFKLTAKDRKRLFETDIEGYHEGLRKADAAKKRKEAAILKLGKAEHPKWLTAWRNFAEYELSKVTGTGERDAAEAYEKVISKGDRNFTRLRTKDGEVFTSKDVRMPVEVAKRYYHQYLRKVEAGGCTDNCGMEMLGYAVKEINADHLWIGCHLIVRSEIDYIADTLGWSKK